MPEGNEHTAGEQVREEPAAADLPTRGDPEPPGPRLFGTHSRRAPAWGRSAGRVWVKPSKLDPQGWGPGMSRTEDTA